MEQDNQSKNVFIKELPKPVAEPACLGLIGLAVAALVLGTTDMGWASADSKSLMIPWTLCLGATAQLIAGIMDFKRNNIFGATAFTTYAMLWYAVSLTLLFGVFGWVEVDMNHYAYGLIGFLFFSLILTVGTLLANKTFFAILVGIDVAIITLVMHIMAGTPALLVGISLLGVSFFSFYGSAAILLNNMAGKIIIPMGDPIWQP
ncbi:MAG: acetate uptake transporter [Thermoplasmata archaeon]